MTWNYRVIQQTYYSLSIDNKKNIYYDIREVYYDSKGNIEGWDKECLEPFGETIKELKDKLNLMLEAFNKPILEETIDLFTGESILRIINNNEKK